MFVIAQPTQAVIFHCAVITIVGLTFVNSFYVCIQVDLSIGFIFTLSTLLINDQMFAIFMKYHAFCNIVT